MDENTFTLPPHESENLTAQQSAEQIAQYFSAETDVVPPVISEYDTYLKIMSAKKPQSGVPGDMPRPIIQEFAPELATPVSKIITNIVATCQWPSQWKLEYVTAIGNIPIPETEHDLRPISLTVPTDLISLIPEGTHIR